jgi:hypothetical protein
MMTAGDVLGVARGWLNDPLVAGEGTRFLNADMLKRLNAGQVRLYGLRPDCVLYDDDTALSADAPAATTSLTDTVTLPDRWIEPLAHFVCYLSFREDSDEHEANPEGKAGSELRAFMEGVNSL